MKKLLIVLFIIITQMPITFLDIFGCPGQCNGDWNYSTTPLTADTNGCGVLVHYRWRECQINGETIREVEITQIDKIVGGNCDATAISALVAIATKALLFYSSGIFMVNNPATPYEVTLYTPACWKELNPTQLSACDLDMCCTTKVTMQTVNSWTQAVNQILISPYPSNCSGIVSQTCDYICDAQEVPLNEPLIPWHFDYSWLCEPACPNGTLKYGSTYFPFEDNIVFVAYAVVNNCDEIGVCGNIPPSYVFHRFQVIRLQIVQLNNLPSYSTYEYIFQGLKRGIKNYLVNDLGVDYSGSRVKVKVLVRQCWKLLNFNEYYSYPCSVPSECCYRYFVFHRDDLGWETERSCPAVVYEPNECYPQNNPCTYNCNWLWNCINNSPWSYCDMFNDYWTRFPRQWVFDLEENKYTLPRTINVIKGDVSDDLSFVIESNISEQLTIQIFDALGNLMQKEEIKVQEGQNEVELSNAKLTNGLYFYNITDGSSVLFYGKFIYIK